MNPSSATMLLSCAQSVVTSLLDHGIRQMFCLPGVQNDHLFNAMYDVKDRLDIIHTRHEQGAAYMALGAAMATGKPAVYSVVPGPGLLNTTAALCTAYAVNAPVMALTGQIPQRLIGRGYGVLHEIPDQLGLLRSQTKWAARIHSPHEAGSVMQEAFRQLNTGRPRPVGVECAIDVWSRSGTEVNSPPLEAVIAPIPAHLIAEAVDLLCAARYPLIIVGGGAQGASELVREVAERLQAPVVSSRMGRGVLDSRHPLSITPPVAHQIWPQVDLVLSIGTRMQTQTMVWGMDSGIKVIRIDVDPEELERHAVPDVGICARAGDALAPLAEALAQCQLPLKHGGELHAQRTVVQQKLHVLGPQAAFIEALRSAVPEDGVFVEEMTQIGYASRVLMPVYQPRTYLSTGYQGTLGWGYATALGAKAAQPQRAVISICGDGGFMFNVQELATAAQHEIGVVAVVFDDGAFGNVKRIQNNLFPGREIANKLSNPDFRRLADSFGVASWRADTPECLHTALTEALVSGGPGLIHVKVGEFPDPWPFLNMPRLRG